MHKSLSLLAAALLIGAPHIALADEVWSSDQYGEIIYGNNVGDTAVLTMAGSHPGSTIHLYLPGLAGNISTRGSFIGYWIETAPGECASEKTGVDEVSSDAWGKLEVVFEKPDFPSGFTMRLGSCDSDFTDEAWAAPVTN